MPPSFRHFFTGRPRTALCGLLLFIAAAGTFLPVLRNGFVDYDDPDYLTENFHVQQGLTWQGVRWAFTDTRQVGFWHPLTWLSHMLDCQMFGLQPWGHHLTNVLLHAVNVLLVFLVFRHMTGAFGRSLLLAALFGLHPLRVESVTWAAERKDVLSALFWLLTLWAYAQFTEKAAANDGRRKFFYSLALGFFLLGLMAKPMLVTLPCALLLLDYWPLGRFRSASFGRLLVEKIPFFLAAFAAAVGAFLAQRTSAATSVGVPLAARAENALVSYARYLGKIFYPTGLAFFYPHPGYWPAAALLFSVLLLLGITAGAVALRRKHPWLLTGWLWFLGTLVPVIGLVQVGAQAMADRFTYIPCLGVLVMAIWSIHAMAKRWRPALLAVASAAAVVPCVALTQRQIGWWENSETLCRHALAVTRDNQVAHFCLGVALEKQGRPDEAVREYQAALAADPTYAAAHTNLGFVLSNEGRFDEATAQFQAALQADADPSRVHFGLGLVFGREGRVPDATIEFQQAVALRPDWPDAHYNLGIALEHEQRLPEAISQLQQAADLDPGSAEFRFELGNALSWSGRLDNAIGQFQKSLELQPGSVECRVDLGNALARTGRLDDAIEQFRAAVQLRPDLAEVHDNLGLALGMRGRTDEAVSEFRLALKLKPDDADAQKNLDDLLHAAGRPPLSR